VIFVADTSSARSAIALLAPSGAVVRAEIHASGRTFDLPGAFREMVGRERLTRVAVATGPGSFTGLRTGVSFCVGLAMGLRIPIVPLATLDIQLARSDAEVMAVSEAGRGRVYYQIAGTAPGLSEADALPGDLPLAGWLRPATEAAVLSAGRRITPEAELRSFGAAVARLLETAREAPYASLKIHYMQSFSARA
jgi:tRNA A37 threonylcarbamoyladenosine modification protein TsaB